MGKVVADITMSLDGLVTGPDDGPGRGLGEGGECLHNRVMGRPWRYDDGGRRFDPVDVDRHVLAEALGWREDHRQADVRCHRRLGRQSAWRPEREVLRAHARRAAGVGQPGFAVHLRR